MADGFAHPDWGNPAYKRWYQRQYRESQRAQGYKRMELCLDQKTWQRLLPFLDPSAEQYPGWAVSEWIRDSLE